MTNQINNMGAGSELSPVGGQEIIYGFNVKRLPGGGVIASKHVDTSGVRHEIKISFTPETSVELTKTLSEFEKGLTEKISRVANAANIGRQYEGFNSDLREVIDKQIAFRKLGIDVEVNLVAITRPDSPIRKSIIEDRSLDEVKNHIREQMELIIANNTELLRQHAAMNAAHPDVVKQQKRELEQLTHLINRMGGNDSPEKILAERPFQLESQFGELIRAQERMIGENNELTPQL